jgi:hypothetical protein
MSRYRIDPERSKVTINASSSVHPIHSEADGLEGWLDLDVQGGGRIDVSVPPTGHLEFPVDLLRGGNALEDRELRRRIDARKFPKISGEMTSMQETGKDGRYLVGGDLTFKGQTNHYEGEMEVTHLDDETVRLQGESEFDVREFGMDPPRILLLKVHPEVMVGVDITAKKED